jgi:hypothetical protein
MNDKQPSSADAAAFWNSLDTELRETLLSGYDGQHPRSLAERLENEGMVFQTVPSPGNRVLTVAEEGVGQPGEAVGDSGVRFVLARELVRILDRGSVEDASPGD